MPEEKLKKKIKYNYWIYMLTYFFVFLLVMKMPQFAGPAIAMSLTGIIRLFVMTLLFSGMAWFTGKKYRLHYSLVCGLGVLVFLIFTVLWEICVKFLFHASFLFKDYSLEDFGIIFLAYIFSVLFIGGATFIISYPIQVLFFKIKNHFVKLR